MGKLSSINIGDVFKTNTSGTCKVIGFKERRPIVKFIATGFITDARGDILRRGQVRDPYLPSVCDVGFIGVGPYNSSNSPKLYQLWLSMLQRCYYIDNMSYVDAKVSKRWHNFQTFCDDIKQMSNWNTPGFELDKDLKIIGNKTYGRKGCSFVPREINMFYTGSKRIKNDLPTGVRYNPNNSNLYRAIICIDGKQKDLGGYTSVEEASERYRKEKIKLAKRLIKTYYNHIDPVVKDNLLKIAKSR